MCHLDGDGAADRPGDRALGAGRRAHRRDALRPGRHLGVLAGVDLWRCALRTVAVLDGLFPAARSGAHRTPPEVARRASRAAALRRALRRRVRRRLLAARLRSSVRLVGGTRPGHPGAPRSAPSTAKSGSYAPVLVDAYARRSLSPATREVTRGRGASTALAPRATGSRRWARAAAGSSSRCRGPRRRTRSSAGWPSGASPMRSSGIAGRQDTKFDRPVAREGRCSQKLSTRFSTSGTRCEPAGCTRRCCRGHRPRDRNKRARCLRAAAWPAEPAILRRRATDRCARRARAG